MLYSHEADRAAVGCAGKGGPRDGGPTQRAQNGLRPASWRVGYCTVMVLCGDDNYVSEIGKVNSFRKGSA